MKVKLFHIRSDSNINSAIESALKKLEKNINDWIEQKESEIKILNIINENFAYGEYNKLIIITTIIFQEGKIKLLSEKTKK